MSDDATFLNFLSYGDLDINLVIFVCLQLRKHSITTTRRRLHSLLLGLIQATHLVKRLAVN